MAGRGHGRALFYPIGCSVRHGLDLVSKRYYLPQLKFFRDDWEAAMSVIELATFTVFRGRSSHARGAGWHARGFSC